MKIAVDSSVLLSNTRASSTRSTRGTTMKLLLQARGRVFASCLVATLAFVSAASAKITVEGTPAQREKIANWLSGSLDAIVSIDAQGVMTVGSGGNASATRLRSMCDDAAANGSIVLKVLAQTDPLITFGGWKEVGGGDHHTDGTQLIDIADIEGIGNVFTENAFTPDLVLMHEITEAYWGRKKRDDCMDQATACRDHGIPAEDELSAANRSKLIDAGVVRDFVVWRKYKKPDGSFVIVVYDRTAKPIDVHWYKETVACDTTSKLILIPDPDPVVHRFTYDLINRQHSETSPFDTTNSHPVAVAMDLDKRMYVAEDLSGPDEVRVFSSAGTLVQTILHPSLVTPTGIDVDLVTGDIFVSVAHSVLKFSAAGALLGSFTVGDPGFTPTDVAIWRDSLAVIMPIGAPSYAIAVTDRATSRVYVFDAVLHVNTGTYTRVFGQPQLFQPEGLSIDERGVVWVASTGNDRIYAFTLDGGGQPAARRSPRSAAPFARRSSAKRR